jgi:hypothetical protein
MQKAGAFINDFGLTIFSVTPSFVEAFCTGDWQRYIGIYIKPDKMERQK